MKFTKNTAKRALRTFIQAFISFIVVNYTMIDVTGDRSAIKQAVIGLLISAVAAGISAVMNLEEKE